MYEFPYAGSLTNSGASLVFKMGHCSKYSVIDVFREILRRG